MLQLPAFAPSLRFEARSAEFIGALNFRLALYEPPQAEAAIFGRIVAARGCADRAPPPD